MTGAGGCGTGAVTQDIAHFTGDQVAWIDIDTEKLLKGEREYRQRKSTFRSLQFITACQAKVLPHERSQRSR